MMVIERFSAMLTLWRSERVLKDIEDYHCWKVKRPEGIVQAELSMNLLSMVFHLAVTKNSLEIHWPFN